MRAGNLLVVNFHPALNLKISERINGDSTDLPSPFYPDPPPMQIRQEINLHKGVTSLQFERQSLPVAPCCQR